MTPFKKGAEANLYLDDWYGRKVVIKNRVPKVYRHPSLDYKLRVSRTIREAENMHEARKASVPTPIIYIIDKKNSTLVMEYVQGTRIKEILDQLSSEERDKVCQQIGREIGRLHNVSLIHGDLTTSNMIRVDDDKIFLIDFGLSFHSQDDEDKGGDLHLMKRALDSTHYRCAHETMRSIAVGYEEAVGKESASRVLRKVREIEYRGRYFSQRA